MPDQVLERFWDKVEVDKQTGCWNYLGSLDSSGYGQFYDKKRISAHRFSYEVNKGKIPNGLQIDHLCRNRSCVNPDHLEVVTQQENQKRSPISFTTLRKDHGGTLFQKAKTHCPKGHPLTENNIVKHKWIKKGWRICLTCEQERQNIFSKIDRRIRNVIREDFMIIMEVVR